MMPRETAPALELVDFRPTMQARDDAANKGQICRQKIVEGILSRLDTKGQLAGFVEDSVWRSAGTRSTW